MLRTCTDYDLCESCEANTTHNPSHVFIQIKTPLPDVHADMDAPLLSVNVYQVNSPIKTNLEMRDLRVIVN